MRRFSATLLLVLFGCTLIAPALVAGPDTKLPSCCRTDGKHRCSMDSKAHHAPLPSGVQIKGLQTKCPFFPAGPAVSATAQAGLVDTGYFVPSTGASHHVTAEQAETLLHISFSRANQKRGPPSLQS